MSSCVLPISLILPTRNCVEELRRHRAEMEVVLPLVAEVIAADSESSDGTAQLLTEWLSSHPNAKILSLPPGLYEAWNSAVKEASQPWIYFSTIGDIITPEGLASLKKTAEETDADLVISPPIMREADGKTPASIMWPVHHFAEKFKSLPYRPISLTENILSFFSYIPTTFLGSSASNLYKTSTLKKYPFPTEFGHAGDVAFATRYAKKLSVTLHPHEVATFTLSWKFTESSASQQRDIVLRLCHEAKESLAHANDDTYLFLDAWFTSMTASKMMLWDWLASYDDMHQNYHRMTEVIKDLETQISQRFPERIWLAIKRLAQKFR